MRKTTGLGDGIEVNVRHKKKLLAIREERAANGNRSGHGGQDTPVSEYQDGLANGASEGAGDETGGILGSSEGREEGISGSQGADRGHGGGIRPADGQNEYPASHDDTLVRSSETGLVGLIPSPAPGELPPPRDLEAEKARKRELDRQRKQRERAAAREKAAGPAQSDLKTDVGRDRADTPPIQVGQASFTHYEEKDTQFNLKDAFTRASGVPEDVRVLTEKEIPDALDKLVFLYIKGSEILDDILEIIVRGHEPVRIWALDPEEAEMLATMQLERAKKDKAAARVVRVLIRLYERLYILLLAGPRLKATGSHIKRSGGLSFK